MLKYLCSLSLIFYTLVLHAEYRVFQLEIRNIKTGEKYKEVYSTLDHLQYDGYNYIPPDHAVVYLDSWKCWGYTGNYKKYCPNPRLKQLEQPSIEGRLPSSENEPPSNLAK